MAQSGVWVTRGFEAFRRGIFGNAGQNLYVSRAGVLQRIFLFDLNRDGHTDLLFCNSQEHLEAPPAYVYLEPMRSIHRIELSANGAPTGAVADLNGDGYDDLVLGMEHDGIRRDLNAFIYYGSPAGLSERYCVELPAPSCGSVAVGDFNCDGRLDLALRCGPKVRLFYQSELGFEAKRFIELDIVTDELAAADLDGDGYADLYCLGGKQPPRVFWGGPEGILPTRCSVVSLDGEEVYAPETEGEVSETERFGAVNPLARVIILDNVPHLFVPTEERVWLVPVQRDRTWGEPLLLVCPRALSVAVGDVNGDGYPDLVFAARDRSDSRECSWVYWGAPAGFDERRKTALPSARACDVAVGDLDGDGCAEIVICQNQSDVSYAVDSLIYRGTRTGVEPEPRRLPGAGARRVFIARTSQSAAPQVILVNRMDRRALGDANPVVYLGSSSGFSPEQRWELRGLGAASALACDVNDDGYPDVIIANGAENAMHLDPGSFVFHGRPQGFGGEPSQVLPTRHAWGLALADLNRDGYLDLIVCGFNNPDLLIFWGTRDGFDVRHPQRIRMESGGVLYAEPRRIYLADLNNDGWLDLVVSQVMAERCFILWGGPSGFDFSRRQELAVPRGSCPVAADLNGNGYLDLIIGNKPGTGSPHDCYVYIYWNGPDGLREDRRTQLPAKGVVSLAVADFNNDNYLDIFAGSYSDGRERDTDAFIYWGEADGFSRRRFSRLRTHSCSGCMAADFNEDGWIDLAVCNHKTFGDHKGDSFVYWNGPEGFNERHITRLPTIGAHGMMAMHPGNQRDRGPEEYYVSEPFELPEGARPRRIAWEAELLPKTWVCAQIRTAPTRAKLEGAAWMGRTGKGDWFESGEAVPVTVGAGRWIQYRLALGAVNSGNTPRVSEVRLTYGH